MDMPGYYILCSNGHEIGVIGNDSYPDDNIFKKLEELEKKKCPICGQKARYSFCNYGSINDCTDVKLVWSSEEKRWVIPKKLTDEQKKELKGHIIRKGVAIKTEKMIKKNLEESYMPPQEAINKMDLLLEEDNGPKKSPTFLCEKTMAQKKKISKGLYNKGCGVHMTKKETVPNSGNKNTMGIDKIYIDQNKDTDILEIVKEILTNNILKKVTPTLLFRMIKARKRDGWTYDKIQDKFGVSQWTAINYLRNIKPDKGTVFVSETFRNRIEERAMEILVNCEFTGIINLGEICPKRHFDFIAFKGKDKWLISVTVGNPRELRNRGIFFKMIPGFICAILYMTGESGPYNLIELKSDKIS